MRKLKLGFLACAVLALGTAARGAVNLQFSSLSVTVDPNVSPNFDVTLQLTGDGPQVLGLDYYLKALGLASGHFQIVDRRIGTSVFNDPTYDDPTVENPGDAVLVPTNNFDLGASAATAVTSSSTARLVAAYTLKVLPGTPTSTTTPYVIESAGPSPSSGWYGNDFVDQGFTSNASIAVYVIPEPASLGLLGMGGALVVGRRRRR